MPGIFRQELRNSEEKVWIYNRKGSGLSDKKYGY
jgi:hypothetical protein